MIRCSDDPMARSASQSTLGSGRGEFTRKLQPCPPSPTLAAVGHCANDSFLHTVACKNPAQVRTQVHHGADKHGAMVDLGADVSVIFPRNRVEKAVVSAVSHSREFGRWRTWLQFSGELAAAAAQR